MSLQAYEFIAIAMTGFSPGPATAPGGQNKAMRGQCVEGGSSLLLVANRIDATKTAMMTGTTKNGEVMCMAQTPCTPRLAANSGQ
jgi:hypothetical protein